jgi:GH24 family phage-related lysozyme (muramidase)
MSWVTFKENIVRLSENPDAIADIDLVAKTYAQEYDACIKRGFDIISMASVKTGNVQMMENLFKFALLQGQSSLIGYDLVGGMGPGVIAYWSGASLNEFPIPTIPAPGSVGNIGVYYNMVMSPGVWKPALLIPPTGTPKTLVDIFIFYAQSHLATITGFILTNSIYPPFATPGPGVLNWTGYSIDPAPVSTQISLEIPIGEVYQKPEQEVSEETISTGVIDINSLPADSTTFENTQQIDTIEYLPPAPKGGGFSSGRTDVIIVNLGALDLSADWITLSSKFIGRHEGFSPKALNDEGTARLGFGSDKILDGGKIRNVKYGDTTTTADALKVLQYEVSVSYKSRLVGSGPTKISEADFNNLNNKQKAACLSFVYNCGSLRRGIAQAIRNRNYAEAAAGLLNGPVKGSQSGKIYPGLVKRRKEESALFLS